ncbi:MAG: type II secretion system F family protein [Bryobacteraceae bacterium]
MEFVSWLAFAVFAVVMVSVTVAGIFFQKWQAARTAASADPGTAPEEALNQDVLAVLAAAGGWVGSREAYRNKIRAKLFRAGYRSPNAPMVFSGVQVAGAAITGGITFWIVSLQSELAGEAFLPAVCVAGFAFMLPSRVLDYLVRRRGLALRRALPAALDLMVLATEAGQSLETAMVDTAASLRRTYPELAAELSFCNLEMRAGASRLDALHRLGERTGEEELRRLALLMVDGERFGSSLGPALRTHARYLRTRMRQQAQEAARKLTVKLVFPVFFLIFPSVMLVTLGPAYLQMRQFFSKFLE